MIRGHEPYDNEGEFHYQDTSAVSKLKLMKFPPLGEGHLDQIIERCWKGDYERLKDLADETKQLRGALELPRAALLNEEDYIQIRKECQLLIENGILNGKLRLTRR